MSDHYQQGKQNRNAWISYFQLTLKYKESNRLSLFQVKCISIMNLINMRKKKIGIQILQTNWDKYVTRALT